MKLVWFAIATSINSKVTAGSSPSWALVSGKRPRMSVFPTPPPPTRVLASLKCIVVPPPVITLGPTFFSVDDHPCTMRLNPSSFGHTPTCNVTAARFLSFSFSALPHWRGRGLKISPVEALRVAIRLVVAAEPPKLIVAKKKYWFQLQYWPAPAKPALVPAPGFSWLQQNQMLVQASASIVFLLVPTLALSNSIKNYRNTTCDQSWQLRWPPWLQHCLARLWLQGGGRGMRGCIEGKDETKEHAGDALFRSIGITVFLQRRGSEQRWVKAHAGKKWRLWGGLVRTTHIMGVPFCCNRGVSSKLN